MNSKSSNKTAKKETSSSKLSNLEKNNQLVDIENFDADSLIFSDPVDGSVPETPIKFKRINISVMNNDKTFGDLLLPTEKVFSFGVSENVSVETKKPNGWVLPLCLWNKNGATPREKLWTDIYEQIVNKTKKHILDNKEELGDHDLEMSQLKKFGKLHRKVDKATNKIDEKSGPTLYAKLIATSGKSKKPANGGSSKDEGKGKILTMFFDKNNERIDPLTLMGKYGFAEAVIKIESIFIGAGNKYSLQVKLYEVVYETMSSEMKPLLARPKGSVLLSGIASNLNDISGGDDNVVEEDDQTSNIPLPRKGSIEPEKEVVKPPTKPIAKKTIQVKKTPA